MVASRMIVVLAGAAPASAWMVAQQQPQVVIQQHLAPRQAAPVMVARVSRRKAALDLEVDFDKLYEPMEAVTLMKKLCNSKFVETAELHGNLNLDPKYNDQQIRTTVALPHGSGKPVRVAVSPAAPPRLAPDDDAPLQHAICRRYPLSAPWSGTPFASALVFSPPP